jgi:hypothetical protein
MSSDVHPLVRNAVIVAIWATVIVPAVAITVALSAYAVRLGVHGDLTVPGVSLGPQTQLLLVLALVGGYGFIVWMALRETFGGEDVDEGVDTAVETAETVQDNIDE